MKGMKQSSILEYSRRKSNQNEEVCPKKKKKDSLRKISAILNKCETLRTTEEIRFLESCADVVKEIIDRRERMEKYKDRAVEKEDELGEIDLKARKLAQCILEAKHLVVYTGAGISTSARIPDYRGSHGIWTLLQQGKEIGEHDLSLAEPTFTHMAISELHKRNIVHHVVSQNCDGLHLRSGLPKQTLSEVHGNMYVEVCKYCKPNREYWRLFDTTPLTSRYFHKTNRRCYYCEKPLIDTIVHFGERGTLKYPLNWDGACKNSERTDAILCLGSSLKVLKKYHWLWAQDRPPKKRPKIFIVNLQWTPKDKLSTIKINGKCDDVMKLVMKYLNIDVKSYDRQHDPIFAHSSLLCAEEQHTASQPMLKKPKELDKNENSDLMESSCTNSNSSLSDNKFILNDPQTTDMQVNAAASSFPGTDINVLLDNTNENKNLNINKVARANILNNMKMVENFNQTLCVLSAFNNFITTRATVAAATNNLQNSNLLMNVINYNNTINKLDNEIIKNINKENEDLIKVKDEIKEEKNLDTAELLTDNSLSNRIDSEKDLENTLTAFKIKNEMVSLDNTESEPEQSTSSNTKINLAENKIAGASFLNNSLFLFPKSFCDTNLRLINYDKCHEAQNPSIGTLSSKKEEFETPGPTDSSRAEANESIYQNIISKYCRVIKDTIPLPHWYDVQYAYSGLHSIIHPPPPNVNLWECLQAQQDIQNENIRKEDINCEFCFRNYKTIECQFYVSHKSEFSNKNKTTFCECCVASDGEAVQLDNSKRAKLDESVKNVLPIETSCSSDKTQSKEPVVRVQAGWYGKGYRYKKKKRNNNHNQS